MKGFVGALLAFLLLAGWVTPAFGEIYPRGNYIRDQWFTIEVQKPYLSAEMLTQDGESAEFFEYYLNDHTFFGIEYEEEVKSLYGSYLWESGWFVGASYSDAPRDNTQWGVSPGYRINLANEGYLAMSGNYSTAESRGRSRTLTGFEFNGVIRPENAKIEPIVRYQRMSYRGEEQTRFLLGCVADYQVSEGLVIGGNLTYQRASYEEMSTSLTGFGLGLTWDNDISIVNFAISDSNRTSRVSEAEILFKISENIRFGAEADRYEGDDRGESHTQVYYTLRYYSGPHRFSLGYDVESEVWQVLYNMDI